MMRNIEEAVTGSDLVELWQANKQDRQKYANMLREALEKGIHK
jgi:hypothetical protein